MSETATSVRLAIGGMSCAGRVATVENALCAVPGVTDAMVNFAEHTASVKGSALVETLIAAVTQAGYEAAELRGADDEAKKEAAEMAHYHRLLRKTVVAAVVGLPLMVAEPLGWLPMLATPTGRVFWLLVGGATLFVLAYSGGHFFKGAWKAFWTHNANIDTLVMARDLPLDQSVDLTIVPDQPGECEFTCQMKMYRGTLVVKNA